MEQISLSANIVTERIKDAFTLDLELKDEAEKIALTYAIELLNGLGFEICITPENYDKLKKKYKL